LHSGWLTGKAFIKAIRQLQGKQVNTIFKSVGLLLYVNSFFQNLTLGTYIMDSWPMGMHSTVIVTLIYIGYRRSVIRHPIWSQVRPNGLEPNIMILLHFFPFQCLTILALKKKLMELPLCCLVVGSSTPLLFVRKWIFGPIPVFSS